jgi:RNA polymerase sigma-B factor
MAAPELTEESVPAGNARQANLPRPRYRRSDYKQLAQLLGEYAGLSRDDPRREALRDRLVVGYLPVARRIALRFNHRGEPLDDLMQVATIGLIHAVDRFRPESGNDFLSFAVPTIRGEIRRYFRDRGWAMRVPRRLKDLHVSINAAVAELSQMLERPPRPSDISERLGVSLDDVLEGLEASHAYRGESLDEELGDSEDGGGTLGEVLGDADPRLELVEYHQALRSLLAELPERERTILMLRFFGNMTQTQIGERVGISQMHVSRLLGQTLAGLRERLRA